MIALDQISQLGIGTSRAASLGSRLSTDQFRAFLDVASAGKVNLIDTADAYGSGDSERLIRASVKASGQSFFIITKAGLPYVHTPGWLSPLNQLGKKVKQKAGGRTNYTAGYLLDSLQKSNKRLGLEAADAFLLHEPGWDDIADCDSWDGLAKIRKTGLARYTGVSTNDYRVVEEGIRSGQVQLVQTSATWNDTGSNTILDLCQTHGIPVIANQVLRPYKSLMNQFKANEVAIHQLDGLADISLVQLLIAAVLTGKKVDAVLFGTSDLAHLAHNIDALRYTDKVAASLPTLNQLLT
ncbi:aldo/keto reductase [Spirosoma utsteinense]|uniref:Aryl-alcohol dehydrogenase-like putative oxidoreductase n=1 Tax=Spirosoma utsteinense TaxID=2585773 RepID=A0ABR6W837_9BACT|nr:aldo/keto reductase [Spirosoma utsteinense]MBC3787719.1 aryl-alcohol dehydrogenase-like putative oxidoreductase [Spirosoma utsteinense]MBC3792677.1 aryl-alcohol dehydrogenase-like putative oxidoreductase [Spirosoma utsteinense]